MMYQSKIRLFYAAAFIFYKGDFCMTELRDSKNKLKAVWNREENSITIRERGTDITFLLKSDGSYDLHEEVVCKKIA